MNQADIGFLLLIAITVFFFLFILVMGVVLHYREKERDAMWKREVEQDYKRRVLEIQKRTPDKVRKILCKRRKVK